MNFYLLLYSLAITCINYIQYHLFFYLLFYHFCCYLLPVHITCHVTCYVYHITYHVTCHVYHITCHVYLAAAVSVLCHPCEFIFVFFHLFVFAPLLSILGSRLPVARCPLGPWEPCHHPYHPGHMVAPHTCHHACHPLHLLGHPEVLACHLQPSWLSSVHCQVRDS